MKQQGFSLAELIVVLAIIAILSAMFVISLNPQRRMVKTEDAAAALYSVLRQARILAVTRRQYYAVVINPTATAASTTLSNGVWPSGQLCPEHSVCLIDMGALSSGDERLVLSRRFARDININNTAELPASSAMPQPERFFNEPTVTGITVVGYFDPSGRAVNAADNTGIPVYARFAFSANDAKVSAGPTLLRAVTLYGASGGLKGWRYNPHSSPAAWIGERKW
ncbi:MAG: prepilin-type N-terminal cleavage/methylation domain-containing protein [Acidobacteriota bacterium]|nr:prepilin-type N-terminal cleavage/methylation domain-containing protein [Blastocatellia bacterium]MDW8411821.1 prepilin-type N-terminal cleavage/methylation domain-containing protein [Acidobacteriota bacterium]